MAYKYKNILIVGGVLALAGGALLMMVYFGLLRFNYPAHEEYPVRGIDVSHHQGDIDWEALKGEDLRFVFMKATEGGDFKDRKFAFNWKEAKKAGLEIGAYHFFTFCKSGREQAKNFTETVPFDSSAMPPVIDLEFGGNCRLAKPDNEIIMEIDTLQTVLFETYKKRPVLYVTKEFYERFMIGRFLENPIWFRDIFNEPVLPDNRNWHFWQYSNRGRLSGVEGYVDLNVFWGTGEDFFGFIKGSE